MKDYKKMKKDVCSYMLAVGIVAFLSLAFPVHIDDSGEYGNTFSLGFVDMFTSLQGVVSWLIFGLSIATIVCASVMIGKRQYNVRVGYGLTISCMALMCDMMLNGMIALYSTNGKVFTSYFFPFIPAVVVFIIYIVKDKKLASQQKKALANYAKNLNSAPTETIEVGPEIVQSSNVEQDATVEDVEKLIKFKELLDRGIVSQEEYDIVKNKLLKM